MFYYLVLQWLAFIVFAFNILQIEGYLSYHYALRNSLLVYGFWTSVLSLIIFSVWRNKKTVYHSLHKTMPNLFFSFILGTLILLLSPELHFFIFVGLAIWMNYMRKAEHADKKKIAFIMVNTICFYLVISGIMNYYISHIATYLITFFVLIFYLFSTYKMYSNNAIAKYNIIAVFLSFSFHLLPYTYNELFNKFLRIYPLDTIDAFSLLLIIPALILTYGYFRKAAVVNPVLLTRKNTVSLWILTFGIPIIGFIIFVVMQGLAGLGS
ncbi:hypothetical protein [Planococcus shenhongbingii]|uniref:Uncharacterized protein n=1 Tax=Planococcus shenhongbingii TaxID=3058398 RepID=A0ABT8NC14_9BACL|nr:hypothetical protein [Planococcus sp. N017]MDN7245403.1 hypothetical protein [Planococcus sp. N017]